MRHCNDGSHYPAVGCIPVGNPRASVARCCMCVKQKRDDYTQPLPAPTDTCTNQWLCPLGDGGCSCRPYRQSNLTCAHNRDGAGCRHTRFSGRTLMQTNGLAPYLSMFKKSSSSATSRLSNACLIPFPVLALTSNTSCGGSAIVMRAHVTDIYPDVSFL